MGDRCVRRLYLVATVMLALPLAFCPAAKAADYAIGADLSFLKQAEDRGTVFKDNGEANEYRKDIILVEVAYCWRPTEYRKRPGPFPETPEGQRDFLDEVHRIVLSTPNGRGIGVFWWEPAVTGGLRARGMFGDDAIALPVITVFDRFARR